MRRGDDGEVVMVGKVAYGGGMRSVKGKKSGVMVVTGSRSEFGLLMPVMERIEKARGLELRVVVAGEHLLLGTEKIVGERFAIAGRVDGGGQEKMEGHVGFAAGCGRMMEGFAREIGRIKPRAVVVLGDRVEAFAAASAGAIGRVLVVHIHGGDRAEGIADEGMRHAISKMAHVHCVASAESGVRLIKMGEEVSRVFVTGSPGLDGLSGMKMISKDRWEEMGGPGPMVLYHPSGDAKSDVKGAEIAIECGLRASEQFSKAMGREVRVGILASNRDPGFEAVERGMGKAEKKGCVKLGQLGREEFVGLMKFVRRFAGGVLIGNSSAGLIECSALGVVAVNIGQRQSGRERDENVIDVGVEKKVDCGGVVRRAVRLQERLGWGMAGSDRFGDGGASARIVRVVGGAIGMGDELLRKVNSY